MLSKAFTYSLCCVGDLGLQCSIDKLFYSILNIKEALTALSVCGGLPKSESTPSINLLRVICHLTHRGP